MAAVSFADELHKWHKQLQTIEAVLVAWLKVQQLWVQLEEVGVCNSVAWDGVVSMGVGRRGVGLCRTTFN